MLLLFSIFSLILLPKNRTLHFIGRKMVISKWWRSLIMLSNKIIHQQAFVCVVMFFLPCMLECHLCYFETTASTLTALQMTALVKALRRWSTDICLINTVFDPCVDQHWSPWFDTPHSLVTGNSESARCFWFLALPSVGDSWQIGGQLAKDVKTTRKSPD